jgi:hypothetical protein
MMKKRITWTEEVRNQFVGGGYLPIGQVQNWIDLAECQEGLKVTVGRGASAMGMGTMPREAVRDLEGFVFALVQDWEWRLPVDDPSHPRNHADDTDRGVR